MISSCGNALLRSNSLFSTASISASVKPGMEGWAEESEVLSSVTDVAGAVAAFLAYAPEDITVAEVKDLIISTGEQDYLGQGGEHPEPLLDFGALMEIAYEYQTQ